MTEIGERMSEAEVRDAFDRLPPLPEGFLRPNTWGSYRLSIREHVANDDISEFLMWGTIQATMFVGNEPFVQQEHTALRLHDIRRWDIAIREDLFGKPDRLPWMVHTSGNMVHQAYHLMQWERIADVETESLDCIVEFGGGYGAMAWIVNRLGFKGEYVIYDLPEMSILQRYYLSNVGVSATLRVTNGAKFPTPPKADLLISCHALGEAPDDLRRAFLAHPFKSYLIASQASWDGNDLHSYFDELATNRYDLEWHVCESPILEDHYYWIGR